MRRYGPLAALLILGCSGPAGGGPTPTPPPAPTAAPSPSAVAGCRLPVASGDAPVDGVAAHGATGRGGFVRFPGGAFGADPASLGAYDLARSRWLPVLRDWISPDGGRYAWPEYETAPGPVTGIIHVTEVGGADHPLRVPAPSMPIGFESAGVYVARVIPASDAAPQGLTLLDPGTGGFRQIAASGSWNQVAVGAAFGVDLDTTVAPGPANPGQANRLRRLDLASAAVTTVATYPGRNVGIVGMRGADPVLALSDASTYSVVVGGATLFSGAIAEDNPLGPAVADAGTIWFGSLSGAIWRSDAGAAATRVASTGLRGVRVAGACR